MSMRWFLVLILALAPQSLPGRAGMVNDYARALTPDALVEVEMTLSRLWRDAEIELVLVTLREARGQDAERLALKVRRDWRVGGGDDPDQWPGLVVAYIEQSATIGVSYNEAARSWIRGSELQQLIDNVAMPSLERGDPSAALRDVMRALARQFQR